MERQNAFTIMEVMVAMSLLLIGVLAVVTQWPVGADMVMLSEGRSTATIMAERFLEEVAAMDFPLAESMGSGSRTDGIYTIDFSVSPGPVGGTIVAEVQVSWDYHGDTNNLRMGTIIASLL